MSANNNNLVPMDQLTSKFDDEVFDTLVTSGDFLPRLQLFGANSEPVKQGKFPMAHYGLVVGKDNIDDLGDTVDIIPLDWRPKAMKMFTNGIPPLTYFDKDSEEFKHTMADSANQNSGCTYGPEFLVYIPKVDRFATYYMNSKTARRQGQEVRARKGQGVTLKVQYIKGPVHSWHGPSVFGCVSPLDIPDMEIIQKNLAKFQNPEESLEFSPEKLEASADGRPSADARPR